jgi:malonate transporter
VGDVLEVTLPVFLLIGAGYLAVWRGVFSEVHTEGLMFFTQRFAIPCLLFGAIARLDLAAGFDWRLLASFYTGSLVCFVAGIAGARLLFHRPLEDAVAIGFAGMFGNTVLLGLPIAERAYGLDSMTPNYAIVAIHSGFCYLLGLTTMEIARARAAPEHRSVLATARLVVRAMFRNALMIGVGLGVIVNLTGVTLPTPVSEAVTLMSRAALPVALFGLGGILVRYRPEGDGRTIAMVIGIAVVLHPAIAMGMGTLLGLSTGQLRAAVISSAMAPGVNSYLFASTYGRGTRVTASAVLLGTAASVLTVSGWLVVLA